MIISISIAALFIALAVQFFVGDLGIAESSKKQREIAALKADIAALENAAVEKHAEIEKLTHDKNVIRAYAILYGMTGGIIPAPRAAANEQAEEETPLFDAYAGEPAQEKIEPFLLRHPILIALLGGIAVASIAFYSQLRIQAGKSRSRQPKKAYAR